MVNYTPTVSGRASVCNWSLSARFLTKEQAQKAVIKIMELEIDFPVSITKVMLDKSDAWDVDIEAMSWASNLASVAKILEEVDYKLE